MTAQFRLLRYLWPHWRDLLIVLAATTVTVGLDLLRPWPTKILVDHVLDREPMPAGLGRLLVWLPGSGDAHGLLFWACASTVLIFFAGTLAMMVTTDMGRRAEGRRLQLLTGLTLGPLWLVLQVLCFLTL